MEKCGFPKHLLDISLIFFYRTNKVLPPITQRMHMNPTVRPNPEQMNIPHRPYNMNINPVGTHGSCVLTPTMHTNNPPYVQITHRAYKQPNVRTNQHRPYKLSPSVQIITVRTHEPCVPTFDINNHHGINNPPYVPITQRAYKQPPWYK